MTGIPTSNPHSFRRLSSSLCSNPRSLYLFTRLRTRSRRLTFPRIYALSTNDIKVGLNIEVDGAPWRVLSLMLGSQFCLVNEFLHVKPGKGASYVRTTLRNYVTGNQVERTFRAGSKLEAADVLKETKQYTYKDGSQYVFMDLCD